MLFSNYDPLNDPLNGTTDVDIMAALMAAADAFEALGSKYRLSEPQWKPEDLMLTTTMDLSDPIRMRVYCPFATRDV